MRTGFDLSPDLCRVILWIARRRINANYTTVPIIGRTKHAPPGMRVTTGFFERPAHVQYIVNRLPDFFIRMVVSAHVSLINRILYHFAFLHFIPRRVKLL